jgi:hypothetical protein
MHTNGFGYTKVYPPYCGNRRCVPKPGLRYRTISTNSSSSCFNSNSSARQEVLIPQSSDVTGKFPLGARGPSPPSIRPSSTNNPTGGHPPSTCESAPRERNGSKKRIRVKFQVRVEALRAYQARNGHLNVRRGEDMHLFNFCQNVRCARKRPGKSSMKITADCIASLDAIGFDWRMNEIPFTGEFVPGCPDASETSNSQGDFTGC